MEQEFVTVDRKYRNRILLILVCSVFALCCTVFISYPILLNFLQKMDPEKSMKSIAFIVFVLFLLPIPIGFKFLSISNRIFKEGRFPSEGMKVLRKTHIVRGDEAKLRAYIFLLLAFMIFFTCIFCAISAHIFIKILIASGGLS